VFRIGWEAFKEEETSFFLLKQQPMMVIGESIEQNRERFDEVSERGGLG
jgi:hypothetical protein